MRAVPRLCELYPGICLATEEKAWKNLSQGNHRMPVGTMKTRYYVSVADNITNSNQANNTIDDLHKKDPLNYLYSAFQWPFTKK
jgi:hypothetical protein